MVARRARDELDADEVGEMFDDAPIRPPARWEADTKQVNGAAGGAM